MPDTPETMPTASPAPPPPGPVTAPASAVSAAAPGEDPNARPVVPAAAQPPPAAGEIAPGPEGTDFAHYHVDPSGDTAVDSRQVWNAAEAGGHRVVGAPENLGGGTWRIQIAATPEENR